MAANCGERQNRQQAQIAAAAKKERLSPFQLKLSTFGDTGGDEETRAASHVVWAQNKKKEVVGRTTRGMKRTTKMEERFGRETIGSRRVLLGSLFGVILANERQSSRACQNREVEANRQTGNEAGASGRQVQTFRRRFCGLHLPRAGTRCSGAFGVHAFLGSKIHTPYLE